MTIDMARVGSLARDHLSAADAATYLGLARPGIALQRAAAGEPSRTHLGGDASLEPDRIWPMWKERPLSILAVLAVDALRDLECDLELPPSGLLNFFYDDDEQPWGFDPAHAGGWRVVLADPSIAVERTEPPRAARFARIDLEPAQIMTFPSWGEEAVTDIFRRDDEGLMNLEEAMDEVIADSGPRHQVGGWPWLHQDSLWREVQLASNGVYVGDPSGYENPRAPALLSGVDDWKLLFQIDSDVRGWMVLQCG